MPFLGNAEYDRYKPFDTRPHPLSGATFVTASYAPNVRTIQRKSGQWEYAKADSIRLYMLKDELFVLHDHKDKQICQKFVDASEEIHLLFPTLLISKQ